MTKKEIARLLKAQEKFYKLPTGGKFLNTLIKEESVNKIQGSSYTKYIQSVQDEKKEEASEPIFDRCE